MPNGGKAHCGNCVRFSGTRCTLRDVDITDSHRTRCRQFRESAAESEPHKAVVDGPIFAIIRFAGPGYVEIPWGDTEPRVSASTTCAICGKQSQGVEVEFDGNTYGLCSLRHYLKLWMSRTPTNPEQSGCFFVDQAECPIGLPRVHRARLDEGTLTVPVTLRGQINTADLFVVPVSTGLQFYTKAYVDAATDRRSLDLVVNKTNAEAEMAFFASMERCNPMDRSGRLAIPRWVLARVLLGPEIELIGGDFLLGRFV